MADDRLQAVSIPARQVRVGMFLVSEETGKPYEIVRVDKQSSIWVRIYTTNALVNTIKHVEEVVAVAIERFEF